MFRDIHDFLMTSHTATREEEEESVASPVQLSALLTSCGVMCVGQEKEGTKSIALRPPLY